MCGFIGVVRSGGRAVRREELEALLPLVARRGPDGSGVFTDGGLGLAAARLAIQGGHEADQPLRSPDGRLVIAYNGELFSSHRRALRQAMRSEGAGEARATSDTALLLAWLGHRMRERRPGDPLASDTLAPLSGAMYAFVLLDLAARDAFLCADGAIKPLHALEVPSRGETWFSSLMAPLLLVRPGPRELDREELARRLVSPDGSGCSLVRSDGLLREVRGAWAPISEGTAAFPEGAAPPAARIHAAGRHDHGEAADVEALREAWADAAREAVEVSGPVSVMLSGGLDSAAVAAWCDRSDLLAITGRFGPAGGPFDEGPDATAVARALGLRHEVVDLQDADLLTDLPTVVTALEEPLGGPGSLAVNRLAIRARAHGRVALSGTGGDEMLGGYARVAIALGRPGPWTRGYEPLEKRMAPAGKDPHARWLAALDRAEDLTPFLDASFEASLPMAAAREFAKTHGQPHASSKPWTARDLARAESATTLPMLLEVEDRVTMWHGLESRPVPSLGRVRAVAASLLDDSLVGKDGEGKRALREALRGAIPETVRTNPAKRGFPTPFHRAARGDGRPAADAILSDRRFVERGWWDVARCRALLDEDRPAHDRALFNVLSLETWARVFLDGDAFRGVRRA